MTLQLEPRLTVPRWLSPAATILALVVALVISGVVIAFVGGDPIRSYATSSAPPSAASASSPTRS